MSILRLLLRLVSVLASAMWCAVTYLAPALTGLLRGIFSFPVLSIRWLIQQSAQSPVAAKPKVQSGTFSSNTPMLSTEHTSSPPVSETPQRPRQQPTSVLKRRQPGEARAAVSSSSTSSRVVFSEHTNGKVRANYYYYDKNGQARQDNVTAEPSRSPDQPLQQRQTPQRRKRTAVKRTKKLADSTEFPDKENSSTPPPVMLPHYHRKMEQHRHYYSPSLRQMKAAVGPLSHAMRKRRFELLQQQQESNKQKRPKGRLSLTGTTHRGSFAALSESNRKRRQERTQLIWNDFNRKRVKEEPGVVKPSASSAGVPATLQQTSSSVSSTTTPPQPTFQFGSSAAKSPPPGGPVSERTTTNSSTAPQPPFQFGSTAANTPPLGPVVAQPTVPQPSVQLDAEEGSPSTDGAAAPQPAFQFGSTAANTPQPGPVAAQTVAQFASTTSANAGPSNGAVAPKPTFQFGSTAANTPPPGPAQSAAPMPSTQFETSSKTPGVGAPPASGEAAPQSTFHLFGSTAAASTPQQVPAQPAAPQPASVQFATSSKTPGDLAAPTNGATAPQPAFQFGSTATDTPPPGPVAAPQPTFQSNGPASAPTFGSTPNTNSTANSDVISAFAAPQLGKAGAVPTLPQQPTLQFGSASSTTAATRPTGPSFGSSSATGAAPTLPQQPTLQFGSASTPVATHATGPPFGSWSATTSSSFQSTLTPPHTHGGGGLSNAQQQTPPYAPGGTSARARRMAARSRRPR